MRSLKRWKDICGRNIRGIILTGLIMTFVFTGVPMTVQDDGLFAIKAFAASNDISRVVDDADLLTDDQEAALEQQIEEYMKQDGIGYVIVTINQNPYQYTSEYAELFYCNSPVDYGCQGKGCLFLIDMEYRNYYFYYSEGCKPYFSSFEVDDVLDDVQPYMESHNYVAACGQFMRSVSVASGENFRILGVEWQVAVVALLVDLGIAIIITATMVHRQKSTMKVDGSFYQEGRPWLVASSDTYWRTTTSVVHRSNNSSHGGGHIGGSHHSGGGGGRHF